jgi:chromodomain-helicase-DNA-binding protein 1
MNSESDSDEFLTNRRHAPTKEQRRRQLQVAVGEAVPSRDVRFSTRQAGKVTNYNEEEDEDMFEEEVSEMTPNTWTVADEGPAIDIVLRHRIREQTEESYDDASRIKETPTKHDFEYLIKWQGKAHIHATWETFENVASYRGIRRLENYFRKTITEEARILQNGNSTMEEKELLNLTREQEEENLKNFSKVDRVIAMRETEEGTEYLIKWKGLTYDQTTWETAELISDLNQNEIDRFLDRSSNQLISRKTESNITTRSKHKNITAQPDYVQHGELRAFQLTGLNFLAYHWTKGNNVVLADEMGLGKTVQTISFMNWLRHDRGQEGPFLVVVPLSTIPAWADTFDKWTPDMNYVIYHGNAAARAIIQEHELFADDNFKRVKFNVLLTTYELINSDCNFLSQIKWQFLAVDEAHRLKNSESQLYQKLREFTIPSRLLITGTPIQNNIGELATLMDFLMPGRLNIEEFDVTADDAQDKIKELRDAIEPYMLRRTKKLVEKDLPPKAERILRVELADFQLDYYRAILTRNYEALNAGAKGPKQSLLNIMMELKKASNHPFLFPNAEDQFTAGGERGIDSLRGLITSSGKMMLLDRLLKKLQKEGHRVLIFSQMVRMLDLLAEYLQLRGYQFQRLDGTVTSAVRQNAIDRFNAPDSTDFCFILSTRAGGLGINLMTADTVIIFDSDWNPQADLQAMARAHRIGQKKPVTVYRLVSKDTVEEEVLERARNKLILEYFAIASAEGDADSKKNFKKISEEMKSRGRNPEEPSSAEDINNILKKRGQKMFEQSGNQKRLEELDIDAVLENAEEHSTEQPEGLTSEGGMDFLKTFEYTDVKVDDVEWDDIIPKEQLEAIKKEQKEKEEAEYLQTIIEQNAPRKKKAINEGEREQRAAKKRARQAAAAAAADVSDESGTEDDPKRPLNEKEIRNLIKGHERFGSFDDRGEEIIRCAKLVGRDESVLRATLDEVLGISTRMLEKERQKEESIERQANKILTKKDKKAVLFDYKGVKRINAETLVERPAEMRMLKKVVDGAPDWKSLRIVGASKPAEYTCSWGAKEDGRLVVGIVRHGYGAWVAIRDDEELELGSKFFLEEHRVEKKEERKNEKEKIKSPGAVHLVRRANYLISVIKDKETDGKDVRARKALENHHRNNKKINKDRNGYSASVSASPAPTAQKKHYREQEKTRHRSHGINGHSSVSRREQMGMSPRRRISGEDDERQYKRPKSEERASKLHNRRSEEKPLHLQREHSSEQIKQASATHNGKAEERPSSGLKRKAHDDSSEHDNKRQKSEERVQHSSSKHTNHQEKDAPKKEKRVPTMPRDDSLDKLILPASAALASIKTAKDPKEKMAAVKGSFFAIREAVMARAQESTSLKDEKFWTYIGQYHWPKFTDGRNLMKTFERVMEAQAAT